MNQCAIQQSCFVRSREERTMFSVDNNRPFNNLVCPKPRRVSLLNGTVSDRFRWPNSHQADVSERAGTELLNLILSRGSSQGEAAMEKSGNTTQPQVASSPPFFIGSPPSRVSNPVTQDALFKEGNANNNNNNNFLFPSNTATTRPFSTTTTPCRGEVGGEGTGFGPGSPGGGFGAAASITAVPSSTSPATPNNYYSPTGTGGGGARKAAGCVRGNFGNNPAVRIEGFDCLDRDRSRNCSIATLA